jgi:hypothetical protein
MKNINYIKSIFCLMLVASFVTGCEGEYVDGDLNDFADFELGPASLVIPNNATVSEEIVVYASNTVGSDRTYTIVADDEATTLEAQFSISTLTIPANSNEGVFTLSVTDDDLLGFVEQTIELSFQGESGLSFGGNFVVSVVEECTETTVILDLAFDGWAEEARYEIFDLSGSTPTVIFSGGDGGIWADLDNTSLSFAFCLAPGDYGIVVHDSYGDGGTEYSVSANGIVLAGGIVPGGNPANDPSFGSATFTID